MGNIAEVYPPFRLVAEYADGTRRTFDGLTEQQAKTDMEAAQQAHGGVVWYDGVTDEHYEHGRYHALTPPPVHLPFVRLDLTDYHGDGIPDVPFIDDDHKTE